jgi:hypothetical protein
MKKIKTYKLYNESLKDKIVGKSDEELIVSIKKLPKSERIEKIINYQLPYDLLPYPLIVYSSLWCDDNNLTSLPDNLVVEGDLHCRNNKLTSLPNNLVVNGNLFCNDNQLTSLPEDLIVKGDLDCRNNKLPKNIEKPIGVKGKIFIINYNLEL